MKKPVTGKQFYDLINSKTLLTFKWPKHLPSIQPKKSHVCYAAYVYPRVVIDDNNEKPLYTTRFEDEPSARKFKSITEKGLNRPIVILSEIPLTDEEGWAE